MLNKLISFLFTFKGLYMAFVIAIVFYGNLHLFGGVTPRHIAILVMIAACFSKENRFPLNNIILLYLLFILSFGVSSFVTGYAMKYLTMLLSYYFVSLVAFWATKILITRYNGLNFFMILFIVLGVFDGVMTISQTLGLGIADRLMQMLHLYSTQEFMVVLNEKRAEDLDYLDSMDALDMPSSPVGGLSIMMRVIPGAFSDGVYNGYFLMTTGVMSLMLLAQKFSFVRTIPWVVCAIGCFCVQERGPILILIVLSLYALYKILLSGHVQKSMLSIVITFVSLLVVMRYVSHFVLSVGSRFAEVGLEDNSRENIYSYALDYYLNHPIFGGFFKFNHISPHPPHNLILNAFIYGGFVGGLAILIILYKQFKSFAKTIWGKVNEQNSIHFILALAYTAFTLNSFLHNKSIVTGEVIVWMLWAAYYYGVRNNQVMNNETESRSNRSRIYV